MWDRIRVFFKDSESIAWARLQMLIGAIWTVISVTDLSPIFTLWGWEKYIPIALVVMGIMTEVMRRAREPHDLGVKTVADLGTVMMPIKTEDEVVVDPIAGTVTVTKAKAEEMPVGVVTKMAGEKV